MYLVPAYQNWTLRNQLPFSGEEEYQNWTLRNQLPFSGEEEEHIYSC